MSECIRCGKCCTWTYKKKEYRCIHLSGRIGEFTTCKIYDLESRVGKTIAEKPIKVKCFNRKDYPIQIVGCTFI